jgi:hypothetical protein
MIPQKEPSEPIPRECKKLIGFHLIRVWDPEGKEYIDMLSAFSYVTPLQVLGPIRSHHCHHVYSAVIQACLTSDSQLSYEVHDVSRDIAIRGSLTRLSNKRKNLLYRHEPSTTAFSGVLPSRSPKCSGMIWCYPRTQAPRLPRQPSNLLGSGRT